MPEKLLGIGMDGVPTPQRVALYYQKTGEVVGKCARSIFANPEVVNIPCDPRLQIASISQLIKEPAPKLLTVLGDRYPVFFRALFPQSQISSFDINPNQLRSGGDANTYIADIGLPGEMARLLEQTDPDVLFLSNIPDYLSPVQVDALAQTLRERRLRHIMTTEVMFGLDCYSSECSGLLLKMLSDTYSLEYEAPKNGCSVVNLLSLN